MVNAAGAPSRLQRALWIPIVVWLIGFPLLHGVLTRVDIVSFEVAGSAQRARELLAGVPAAEVTGLRWGIGLDYLYLAAYGFGGWWLCRNWAPRAFRAAGWKTVCVIAGWAAVVSALLDAVENASMLRFLAGDMHDDAPMVLAKGCAIAKFVLVAAVGIVLLVALIERRRAARALAIARSSESSTSGAIARDLAD